MTNQPYHVPVLLKETVNGLHIESDGVYVDVTFGGGGHSREIISQLGEKGKLVAFDQDKDAQNNVIDDKRFLFVPQNFRFLKNFLKFYKLIPVNGVLADLGVSSHQFDTADRGFSLRFEGDLDMRMDHENPIDAKQIVNEYEAEELSRIFKEYGELKESWKVAKKIVAARTNKSIERTEELIKVLEHIPKKGKENSFYARVFQALRIEVNQEIDVLKSFLNQLTEVVKPGGYISIISYHSLEDRLVKNFIRSGNTEGKIEKDFFGNVIRPFEEVNRKIIIPNEEEIKINNRARSAKLRIARRLEEQTKK